jgi:hypothetical protein
MLDNQPEAAQGPATGPYSAFGGWDRVWAGAPGRLPGRGVAVRSVLIMFGFFALFGVALVAVASPDRRPLLVLFLLCVPAIVIPIRKALRPARVHTRVRAIRTVTDGKLAGPAPLVDLVTRRHGPMEVQVFIEDHVVKSRAMRVRDRAWVVISVAHVGHPDVRRFVTLHETAHLLRNDTLRYELTSVLTLTLAESALISTSVPGLAVGLAAALALQLIGRWPAELACDTLATRWAGSEGMALWVRQSRRLRALPANRTVRRRLRRVLLSWLTHPPLPLRLRWVDGAASPPNEARSAVRAVS